MLTRSEVRQLPERGERTLARTSVTRSAAARVSERPLSLLPTIFVPLRRGEDPAWQDVVARKV